MTDTSSPPNPDHSEADSTNYATFILRCWVSEGHYARIRLTDVGSGVSHLVTDLDTLPGLLRRLIQAQRPGKE